MISNHPLSAAIRKFYQMGMEDETLEPLVLTNATGMPVGRIKSGDPVIFYNIRGEREIELSRSLTEKNFKEFPVEPGFFCDLTTMIRYHEDLDVSVAFPPDEIVEDTLSDVLSSHRIRQVKITEAEKAIHVGFFLNGKKNDPVPGEDRIIVPTRKDIVLFDEAPEMSITDITEATLSQINDPDVRFIFTNFPNVDVVGHIEHEQAVLAAVEAVDRHMAITVEAALQKGMSVIITADHGTVEKWRYPDGTVDTGHTNSAVPFFLLHGNQSQKLRQDGKLSDIAPTILDLFGLPKPAVMTGRTLIESTPDRFPAPCQRLLFILLDGWGENPEEYGNLIHKAATPAMDEFKQTYPWTTLLASGEAVGLPHGTVGNSEAGHLHIGAGRTVYSDRLKIDRSIEDGSFFENPAFLGAMKRAITQGKPLHLMGIVSFFSSHGSIHHLFALMKMARNAGVPELYLHAMLGRRGEQPESGAIYIERLEEEAQNLRIGKVVSVIGRYWSMDREENWDRIEKTYRMLLLGVGMPVPEGG
ncbi:MAG: alkaline phosphatase family protein [Syntrophaceae bacterium]|nr:alkaline phosphatase family protein [Syntrophaceae bacterium]